MERDGAMENKTKIELEKLDKVAGGNYNSGDNVYCKGTCGRHLPKNMLNAMGYCDKCYNEMLAKRYN